MKPRELGKQDDSISFCPPVLLPVRHHSPACAFHVQRVLEEVQPTLVLIEGPADGQALLSSIADEATIPPVALYAYVRPNAPSAAPPGATQPPSVSLFYPFCAYSPEYIAIRMAAQLGARCEFIDLPSWRMALDRSEDLVRMNAYADRELSHHRFVRELCRKTRTRDFDDFWDAHFEASFHLETSESFFAKVATYGELARQHSFEATPSQPLNDAREEAMAQALRAGMARNERIVAVIGAFHRPGLLARLTQPAVPELVTEPPKDRGIYLTLYGYEQLSRWSGYESGMPAPEWCHHTWTAPPEDVRQFLLAPLYRLARALRKKGERISTADLIAATGQLQALARLRHHPRPTLEDLLDAVRSSWIKSPHEGPGSSLLETVRKELVGRRIGKVAESAGRAPIVEDFHRKLKDLAFIRGAKLEAWTSPRDIHLDIYRDAKHRPKSAFLHQLVEIKSPFAQQSAGPNFVQGIDCDRVRETWRIQWKPAVEGALVEASSYGATVAEAAAAHLLERMEQAGHASSLEAVRFLTAALVMDLAAVADPLWDQVDRALHAESQFHQAAQALGALLHLKRYRTILAPARAEQLRHLIGTAYERAVWLIDSLPGLPPTDPAAAAGQSPADEALAGLLLLRHAAIVPDDDLIDPDLLISALERTAPRLTSQPLLEGAVLATLKRWDRVETEDLRRAMADRASSTGSQTQALGEFVRGVILARRHALAEDPGLLEVLHDFLRRVDEEGFRSALPGLRWAFTPLSPRELQQIRERIDDALARTQEVVPAIQSQEAEWLSAADAEVERFKKSFGW